MTVTSALPLRPLPSPRRCRSLPAKKPEGPPRDLRPSPSSQHTSWDAISQRANETPSPQQCLEQSSCSLFDLEREYVSGPGRLFSDCSRGPPHMLNDPGVPVGPNPSSRISGYPSHSDRPLRAAQRANRFTNLASEDADWMLHCGRGGSCGRRVPAGSLAWARRNRGWCDADSSVWPRAPVWPGPPEDAAA